MNELLRVSGFIGVGLIVMGLAKKMWIAVDMKRLSRTPPEELYEECGGKEEWRDTEREPHKES